MDPTPISTPGGPDRSSLADLYARLRVVNENIKDATGMVFACTSNMRYAKHQHDTPEKQLLAQATTLKRHLEGEQKLLRESIDKHSKSRMGTTNICDMPEEILSEIFTYLRGRVCREQSVDFVCKNYSNKEIKNIRLACRVFCRASSHLLFNSITVRMEETSLEALEYISRHPDFNASIRGIRASLTTYSNVLGGNIDLFIRYHIKQMRKECKRLDGIREWKAVEQEMKKANFIINSWENLVGKPRSYFSAVPREAHYQRILRDAHGKYVDKLYYQEDSRLDRSFVCRVAAAISRMPNVSRLEICSGNWMDNVGTLFDTLRQDEILERSLLLPLTWEEGAMHANTVEPLEMLHELPRAIYAASGQPRCLAFRVPITSDWRHLAQTAEQTRGLAAASQGLEILDFSLKAVDRRAWMPQPRNIEEIEDLVVFSDALLDTRSLRCLRLDFRHLWLAFGITNEVAPIFSLGPLISNRSWPRLEEITLGHLSIDLKELKSFARNLPDGVALWMRSPHLLSGKWEWALDLLREHFEGYLTLEKPSGAECDTLPWLEKDSTFERRVRKPQSLTGNVQQSLAEMYVSGAINDNPLRPPGQENADG
ncbi:hypothetical protein JX265_009759 [Neoarthrinium moseri]|uniref:F-box domain-containing protein n=1 Tax=Neoarthrinium moseri TaxID=1658444 RepID=A0A9Q0ALE0_9PEZI|nr:hypothetical protein JX265_009759 [Neoarthrinium moseri]